MGVRVRAKDGCYYVFINHRNRRKAKKIAPVTKENFKLANREANSRHMTNFWVPALGKYRREGEMLTLQYGDLDFVRRKIVVRRTWGSRNARKNLLCINTPKSGKARHFDMSPQRAEVLQTRLPHMRPATARVFPGASGTRPMTPNGFAYLWERLLKRAGLAHRGPHAVRHTYASILLDRGENPLCVKEQLGHGSIKISMDTYGHLLRKKGPAGAATLDDPEICNRSATTPPRLVAADGASI
jgi:integrase